MFQGCHSFVTFNTEDFSRKFHDHDLYFDYFQGLTYQPNTNAVQCFTGTKFTQINKLVSPSPHNIYLTQTTAIKVLFWLSAFITCYHVCNFATLLLTMQHYRQMVTLSITKLTEQLSALWHVVGFAVPCNTWLLSTATSNALSAINVVYSNQVRMATVAMYTVFTRAKLLASTTRVSISRRKTAYKKRTSYRTWKDPTWKWGWHVWKLKANFRCELTSKPNIVNSKSIP